MNYYVHNIDPIIFSLKTPSFLSFFPEYLDVRWYGLAYLLGFVFSFLLLKKWTKKETLKINPSELSDFIILIGFFGVFLGGRLGYLLFYDLNNFLINPLIFFKIWEGGMASHGGFIGVIITTYWYAKKKSLSFWNLSDHLAATASIGIGFGRIANFINGELWGKVTYVDWAVIFPQSGTLDPRHPSQLYQSLCEGFLVFILIILLRTSNWGKRKGAISCSFLILYSLGRITMEFFRFPDSTIYFNWMTKGQLYSFIIIIISTLVIFKLRLYKRP
tara:strand:+ start:1412 stop:2233 length:822 start_codon:yes stop_codon:yes gene_type:complete